MYLEFVRVPEPKTIKNRLHLGCNVGPIDEFDEEFERLQALGAELACRDGSAGVGVCAMVHDLPVEPGVDSGDEMLVGR
jgi:hypothetical protein